MRLLPNVWLVDDDALDGKNIWMTFIPSVTAIYMQMMVVPAKIQASNMVLGPTSWKKYILSVTWNAPIDAFDEFDNF